MGAEPIIAKNPNFTFPTGRQRPTFNNQLIKIKLIYHTFTFCLDWSSATFRLEEAIPT